MARDRNVLDLLNRTFTPEQEALIKERQIRIRDILRAAYEEPQFIALTTAQSLRSRGGVTRERLLVFGKVSPSQSRCSPPRLLGVHQRGTYHPLERPLLGDCRCVVGESRSQRHVLAHEHEPVPGGYDPVR